MFLYAFMLYFCKYNLIMFYPFNFYFDIIRTLFNVLKISKNMIIKIFFYLKVHSLKDALGKNLIKKDLIILYS